MAPLRRLRKRPRAVDPCVSGAPGLDPADQTTFCGGGPCSPGATTNRPVRWVANATGTSTHPSSPTCGCRRAPRRPPSCCTGILARGRYPVADPSLLVPAPCSVWAVAASEVMTVPDEQGVNYVARGKEARGQADRVEFPGDHVTIIDPTSASFPAIRDWSPGRRPEGTGARARSDRGIAYKHPPSLV